MKPPYAFVQGTSGETFYHPEGFVTIISFKPGPLLQMAAKDMSNVHNAVYRNNKKPRITRKGKTSRDRKNPNRGFEKRMRALENRNRRYSNAQSS